MNILKYILIAGFMIMSFKICSAQSIIDIPSGTEINIGTGAEVCADMQTGDGTLSGVGTWCGGTLPVELASFTSIVNGRDVNLSWITSYEINNSGFDLERKAAGNEWTKLAFIPGSINSQENLNYNYSDKDLLPGSYRYRLKQIDINGNYEYFELENEVVIGVPDKFELHQNYPNPFNPETKISFSIPEEGTTELKIFDLSGKDVMTLLSEQMTSGYYTVTFNAGSLSSGTYFYRIVFKSSTGKNFNAIKKMIVVK